MLELFQQTWNEISQRMPEMAEAGYDSLWLPAPAKGNSGSYSTGYDAFDPFDLGSTNQQGTIATYYGTQSDLIRMVQTAHRFGIRVYFDNVMNHRASTVPGYPGSGTPTNYYPGLQPEDFHLQVVSGGYANWPEIGANNQNQQWCITWDVENLPLIGLCDLANEPGLTNLNFGASQGDTILNLCMSGSQTVRIYIWTPTAPCWESVGACRVGTRLMARASPSLKTSRFMNAARWRGHST